MKFSNRTVNFSDISAALFLFAVLYLFSSAFCLIYLVRTDVTILKLADLLIVSIGSMTLDYLVF